ncbi:hypothetical protein ACFXTN_032182 [Malus domestica]
MVILSAVIASVVSEAGLCSEPAFKVPYYDFGSPADYRIVLLLLGAVGLSSWITSGQTRRKVNGKTKKLKQGNTSSIQQPEVLSPTANGISSSGASAERTSNASDLCEIESSLCIDGSDTDTEHSASLPVDARLLKRAQSWFCLNNYKSKYN